MIIIFTHSYPFDIAGEQTFLGREIPYLLDHFDRVILVPKVCDGRRLEIPSKVEVDEDYAALIKKNSAHISPIIKALSSKHFLHEFRLRPEILFSPAKILRLLLFLSRAELTGMWVSNWSHIHNIDLNHCILYSYWFDHSAMGLGLIKGKFSQVKVVSRAHGYDIYEELYFPYYWPLRSQTLSALDKLFVVSRDGKNYFSKRYPVFRDLFEISPLGTEDPGFLSISSKDGVLRIVSCANIVKLKRIDLLAEGIAVAARMRPEQNIEWHHFGDGKGRTALQKIVNTLFPQNAQGYLPGYVPNEDVIRHYAEKPVDIFVNLSTTEGSSVSIQEAVSCGIPVIATNVGGNPEIVSERNGILLSADPTPEEVAHALLRFCANPETFQKMRKESRRIWEENYNAKINFRTFAERLKQIWQS